MTAEDFFKTCIMDVVGTDVSETETYYIKATGGQKWQHVATLEKMGDASFLWVRWPHFYMPLIDNFKMKEDEVTEFIREQLSVDLVGFLPSYERHMRMVALEHKHTAENQILEMD